MTARVSVTKGRFRKRVFVLLDNGVALEICLPIIDAKRDQASLREAKQVAEYVAAHLNATEHIPTEFLQQGLRFTDDEHNEFTFPRTRLVGWMENILWRFGITLCKPADWATRKAKIFRAKTKTGKAKTMRGRNDKGQFLKRSAWWRD